MAKEIQIEEFNPGIQLAPAGGAMLLDELRSFIDIVAMTGREIISATNRELREDGSFELREDGGIELRED